MLDWLTRLGRTRRATGIIMPDAPDTRAMPEALDTHEKPEAPGTGAKPASVGPTALFLERLKDGGYDFLDLGTCNGGGFKIAERQGGVKGLGFDLDPRAVQAGLDRGLDVAHYDICDLGITRPVVDFAVCSHILEHLPSLGHIERVLGALPAMCRDYLLVSGPCFEEEDYLLGLDLKLLHSLQVDHTCKMTVGEFMRILHANDLRDYVVALGDRIHDSDNHWVHSAAQTVPPEGLWTYEAGAHLPKPKVPFDREIYRDFVCAVALRPGIDLDGILSKFLWGYDKVVNRSSWRFADQNL